MCKSLVCGILSRQDQNGMQVMAKIHYLKHISAVTCCTFTLHVVLLHEVRKSCSISECEEDKQKKSDFLVMNITKMAFQVALPSFHVLSQQCTDNGTKPQNLIQNETDKSETQFFCVSGQTACTLMDCFIHAGAQKVCDPHLPLYPL